MQIVLPFSSKLKRRHAETVWANCLLKLFSVGFIGVGGFLGWVVFWGGLLSFYKNLLRLFLKKKKKKKKPREAQNNLKK